MDNVLNLDGYKRVKGAYNDSKYGAFVKGVKNKYGNRVPPLMINTVDNFNNTGTIVQAGGPSEKDVWFVFIPSKDALYVNDNFLAFLKDEEEVDTVSASPGLDNDKLDI